MKVNGKNYRTIWLNEEDERVINIIDQRCLPHRFVIEELRTLDEVVIAIKDMHVRGAGLIGAAAAYGMYLAAIETGGNEEGLIQAGRLLKSTRPTAVNLEWAVDRMLAAMEEAAPHKKIEEARNTAQIIP